MINLRKLEVIEIVEDNKVAVELDNKKYVRTVRTNVSDQKYIKVNNREFLV